jgi:hypothetical protein
MSALTGLIVCYVGMVVVSAVLAVYMWWENKRRDRLYGAGEDEIAVQEGFRDLTDGENKHFRYAL